MLKSKMRFSEVPKVELGDDCLVPITDDDDKVQPPDKLIGTSGRHKFRDSMPPELQKLLSSIDDRDRTAFREAANTVLDNFTVEELSDLGTIARKVETIIRQAQQRQQEKLNKTA